MILLHSIIIQITDIWLKRINILLHHNTPITIMAKEDVNNYQQTLYNSAERIITQFYKVIFLETCFYFNITPKGLRIKKDAQSINTEKVQERWDVILGDAERTILKVTIEEDINTMYAEEVCFWERFENSRKREDKGNFSDWFIKT